MLSRRQEIISSLREEDYKRLSPEILADIESGKYNLRFETRSKVGPLGTAKYYRIVGKAGNLNIDVTRLHAVRISTYGSVDGKEVSQDLADEIFHKYLNIARLQDSGNKKRLFGLVGKTSMYDSIADEQVQHEEEDETTRKFEENVRKDLL